MPPMRTHRLNYAEYDYRHVMYGSSSQSGTLALGMGDHYSPRRDTRGIVCYNELYIVTVAASVEVH